MLGKVLLVPLQLALSNCISAPPPTRSACHAFIVDMHPKHGQSSRLPRAFSCSERVPPEKGGADGVIGARWARPLRRLVVHVKDRVRALQARQVLWTARLVADARAPT